MAAALDSGALALALLTGEELLRVLQTPKGRARFFERFAVAGDFSSTFDAKAPLARRIFIVTPRDKGAAMKADRILILIECKSTVNAVKSLLHSMPDRPIHAEQLTLRAHPARGGTALVRLSLAQSIDGIHATSRFLAAGKTAGLHVSILGIYPGTEDYGG